MARQSVEDIINVSQDEQWFETLALRLRKRFHDRRHFNKREPLAELVFIILSIQTEEERYLESYRNLRDAYPTWSKLRCACPQNVAMIIKPAGLSIQKARHIVSLLRVIKEQTGSTSLNFLKNLAAPDAEKFLCSLPGVGVKTARCVVMYTIDKKAFPVDVHCWRILRRIGIHSDRSEKPTIKQANALQDVIPPELRFSLHVNFVSLGRAHCRPQNPRCDNCPILDMCYYGLSQLDAENSSIM